MTDAQLGSCLRLPAGTAAGVAAGVPVVGLLKSRMTRACTLSVHD